MAEEGLETAEQGETTEVPEEKEEKEAPKAAGESEKEAPPESPEEPKETPPEAPSEPEKKAEKKELPKEIKLSAVDGSEIHVAQLALLNLNAGVKQLQQELVAAEAKVVHLREKLGWESNKLTQERNNVLGVLSRHGVPDGWRFNRQKDGSYLFTPPPQPPAPRAPVG
jgi:hypothetical protein